MGALKTPSTPARSPRSLRSVLVFGLGAGVAAGLGGTLLLCLLEWLGRVSFDTNFLIVGFFCTWVAVTLVALLGLLSRRFRRRALATLLATLVAPLVFCLTENWTWDFRVMALESLVERSQPLVDAIHAYEQRHDEPPPSLSALVPEFLAEVPGTGMPVCPEFDYVVFDRTRELRSLGWELSVGRFGMNVWGEDLTYRPDRTLDLKDEEFVKRFGTWVLLHHD